jgi:hypothetical protein
MARLSSNRPTAFLIPGEYKVGEVTCDETGVITCSISIRQPELLIRNEQAGDTLLKESELSHDPN